MKFITKIFACSLICSLSIFAQEKNNDASQPETATKVKGIIKGRVLGDDGQPLEGVQVSIGGVGVINNWHAVTTDEDGNFFLDGLPQLSYRLTAQAKGFVLPNLMGESKPYHLGDVVNLSLVKGGVITGRVTSAVGDPVVGARMQAIRVRDAEGRKVTEQNVFASRIFKTDDRGIYRLYGLPAGKYIISSGGKPMNSWGPDTVFDTDTPTYYPSGARDTAVEVSVNLGEEAANINIRYRSEKGYFISGKIIGEGAANTGPNNVIIITLLQAASHSPSMTTAVFLQRADRSFAFYGVSDGEYEVLANTNGFGTDPDQKLFAAPPRRVSVKGGNVENIILSLQPLAAVAGKIVVESVAEKTEKQTCKSGRQSLPDEIVVKIVHDTGGKEEPYDPFIFEHTIAPNDKGEINFRNLFAGHYYFTTQLPDDTWYVKTISLPAAISASAAPAKSTVAAEKSAPKIDVGKQGISLSAGEKRKDLLLTISSGAANLSGKISAAPNKPLPARMLLHLVPAEKETADDLLRYAEYKIKADGTFEFKNLAPGKYLILTRAVPDEESDEKAPQPLAWDAARRAALRREAEARNEIIELNSCQPRRDYDLKMK